MRLLLLSAGLIGSAATAVQLSPARDMPTFNPDASAPSTCPPTSRYEAARRGGKLAPRHLDELPAADLYKAVWRHIGRCEAPIIVRYNIGARPERQAGKP